MEYVLRVCTEHFIRSGVRLGLEQKFHLKLSIGVAASRFKLIFLSLDEQSPSVSIHHSGIGARISSANQHAQIEHFLIIYN